MWKKVPGLTLLDCFQRGLFKNAGYAIRLRTIDQLKKEFGTN